MKNEELSKRISDLECEIENIKRIVEAEGSLAKHEPSIIERCPVGSFVCGMEILAYDGSHIPFKIRYENSVAWLEKEIVETLANCHDWIEKYYPFLEGFRETWQYHADDPVVPINKVAKRIGLWANKTPITKPWEDA